VIIFLAMLVVSGGCAVFAVAFMVLIVSDAAAEDREIEAYVNGERSW
jgi:hypothetical protein